MVPLSQASDPVERSLVDQWLNPDKSELPGDFNMPIWVRLHRHSQTFSCLSQSLWSSGHASLILWLDWPMYISSTHVLILEADARVFVNGLHWAKLHPTFSKRCHNQEELEIPLLPDHCHQGSPKEDFMHQLGFAYPVTAPAALAPLRAFGSASAATANQACNTQSLLADLRLRQGWQAVQNPLACAPL